MSQPNPAGGLTCTSCGELVMYQVSKSNVNGNGGRFFASVRLSMYNTSSLIINILGSAAMLVSMGSHASSFVGNLVRANHHHQLLRQLPSSLQWRHCHRKLEGCTAGRPDASRPAFPTTVRVNYAESTVSKSVAAPRRRIKLATQSRRHPPAIPPPFLLQNWVLHPLLLAFCRLQLPLMHAPTLALRHTSNPSLRNNLPKTTSNARLTVSLKLRALTALKRQGSVSCCMGGQLRKETLGSMFFKVALCGPIWF